MNKADKPISEDDEPDLGRRRFFLPSECEAATPDVATKEEEQAPEPDVAEEAPTLQEIVTAHILAASKNGQLVRATSLLAPPISAPEEELPDVLESICGQTSPEIAELKGDKDRYYYATEVMADNYANILFAVEDKDACGAIVETVRFESKTYPRPYSVEMLKSPPYCFSESQIEAALSLMKQKAEYEDIQQVKASNDALYLFSNLFITYGHAKGLSEWIEVEQFNNP